MHMRLVIDVTYDSGTTTREYAKAQLEMAAEYLVNNGLLSGDGPAVVDDWKYQVWCAA